MRTAYTNCTLFDGTSHTKMQPGTTIVVDDDRIEYVGAELPVALIDETVDLNGAYVMPGLINLHAHHFGHGKPAASLGGGFAQKALLAYARTSMGHRYLDNTAIGCLKAALYSGVTTERGVGDVEYSDVRVRDRINKGEVEGPRFLVSGPAITVANGHGAGTFAEVAETPEEFAAVVDERAKHNVDFIKICTTGGVMDSMKKGEAGLLRMTVEQTKAVCDRAHKLGMCVASHTESTEGIEVDLKGGVDTVEHGAPLTEELARLFKEQGAADICTISVALPLARLTPEQTKLNEVSTYNAGVVLERIIQGAKDCLAHDIPVGLGTDAACPFITHYDLWREVVAFNKLVGADPALALTTVTLGNAKILGLDHITGSVEAGKCADFIVLRENPLDDLHNLRNVEQVIVRGKRIADAKTKLDALRNPQIDSVLDGLY